MKWISITERLPPLNKWVLCVTTSEYNEKKFHIGRREIKGNFFEIGHNPDDYYGTRVIIADYWMPLPEAPKESEK